MITNLRTAAKITGYSLVLMAIVAGFSYGFAFMKIYIPNQPDVTIANVASNVALYKMMVAGFLIVLLLDVLVAWTLFVFFKQDNKTLAQISFLLRIIYSLIFGMAIFYLQNNLTLSNSPLIVQNFDSYMYVWSIALIVFGIYLLIVSVLMSLHKPIPKILSYITMIAGFSYVLIHSLKIALPHLTATINLLENILTLPMILGELGFALWLIIKGGKATKQS